MIGFRIIALLVVVGFIGAAHVDEEIPRFEGSAKDELENLVHENDLGRFCESERNFLLNDLRMNYFQQIYGKSTWPEFFRENPGKKLTQENLEDYYGPSINEVTFNAVYRASERLARANTDLNAPEYNKRVAKRQPGVVDSLKSWIQVISPEFAAEFSQDIKGTGKAVYDDIEALGESLSCICSRAMYYDNLFSESFEEYLAKNEFVSYTHEDRLQCKTQQRINRMSTICKIAVRPPKDACKLNVSGHLG